MNMKRKRSSRISSQRDEAPAITPEWVAEADLHQGERLVRRGRPRLKQPRELLSIRLPPSVIASWKASGPGWQTRMAEVLEKAQPRARHGERRAAS